MGRLSHFEITADDPDRAAEFYRKAFGWELKDWGGPFKYILATTGPKDQAGIDGAIMPRHDTKQAVINTISVDSWEAGARAVSEAGGKGVTGKKPVPGPGLSPDVRSTA